MQFRAGLVRAERERVEGGVHAGDVRRPVQEGGEDGRRDLEFQARVLSSERPLPSSAASSSAPVNRGCAARAHVRLGLRGLSGAGGDVRT